MSKDSILLAEAYKKVVGSKKIGAITSFDDLPDRIPYGFCVYQDGSVDAVSSTVSKNHEATFISRGIEDYEEFYNLGGARVVFEKYDDLVLIQADLRSTRSRLAVRVAKDIAKWYQKKHEVEELEDLPGHDFYA